MIINENILKKFIFPIQIKTDKLKKIINNHIIEVSIFNFFNKNQNVDHNFIIGEVIEIEKIDENSLNYLVKINIGKKNLSIFCNKKNIKKNRKVIVQYLKKDLNQKNKIHNKKEDTESILSLNICSAFDLGLKKDILTEDEKQDVLFLDNQATNGFCALKYLGLKGFFLELTLTPDRNDLLSYIGFAKDLKAVLNNDKIKFNKQLFFLQNQEKKNNPFRVKISSLNCYEYNLLYIDNIKIETSPLWLRNMLFSHNIIPVNNLIDVMNLILLEYGIPLDAFDVSSLKDYSIEIRNAYENEFFFSEDNKKYNLTSEDLIITNKDQIISIAGILTNSFYSISTKTKKIILCSSFFEPSCISRTSRKIGIKNEKITRWSRGIDQNLIKKVLEKANYLLNQITNVSFYNEIITVQNKIYNNPKIDLSLEFVNSRTGIKFTFKEIYNFLHSLEYYIKIIEPQILQIIAPSYRYNIQTPEDVIADIIRMYGYNKVLSYKNTEKKINGYKKFSEQKISKLRNLLSNLGLNETITYSLIKPEIFSIFIENSDNPEYLTLKKPLSLEKNILRQNLSGSLIEVLSFNQRNQNFDNAFFEIGHIYNLTEETINLSVCLSGNFINSGWLKKNIKSSFFILKGILSRIQYFFGVEFDLKQNSEYKNLSPIQQANIYFQNKKIGFIGEIHPSLKTKFHIQDSFIFEINLYKTFLEESKINKFKEITKFPYIIRDLSFLINKKYNFNQIFQTLKNEISDFLVECKLLDFFQDDKLSLNEYSLTFRLIFNSSEKSLRKENVNDFMKLIESKLIQKYKIKIR
jgi:phenylalanyl-tRNA synthetase beta chain